MSVVEFFRIDAELSNTSDDTGKLNVAEREALLMELGIEGLIGVRADFELERLRAGNDDIRFEQSAATEAVLARSGAI